MRALALLAAFVLVAGCTDVPADRDAADPVPGQGQPDPGPESGRTADAGRTGRDGETTYTCESSQAVAVGGGGSFLAGALAFICPDVSLSAPDGESFRSGRLVMEWTQPAPTMADAYVELTDGDAMASGSSPDSPVVVEFQVEPTESLTGTIHYGGTGAAVAIEVTITLEMSTIETPPALASA